MTGNSAIDSITSVPITIDVTDQGNNGSKTYNVSIAKPSGVRYMPTTSATVTVNFGEAAQKTIDGIKVETRNVPNNMSVNAKTDQDKTVSVQVIGVQSVIDIIDEEDIKVYVDVEGYDVGTHEVDVIVKCDDVRVVCTAKVKKATLVISKKWLIVTFS